ncbi:MAG: exosome complex RNA-binding protein Csl4, partial [Candidatus Thorarchaeota archaeon]
MQTRGMMNTMADVKSGDVVVPGDQLCVIEELMPGFGTYEEDGIVYAATSGGVAIDLKGRSIKVVNVDGRLKLALPVKGDIVIGEVTNAWEQRAEVTIVKRNDEYTLSPFIGEIHISNVTRRFVKSMSDVLQKG